MSIALNTVDFFRDQWATRFAETADITRVTDQGTINPTTLLYDGTPDLVYGDLALLVRPAARRQTVVVLGEEARTFEDYDVYAPWDTDGIRPDDTITVKTSTKDPELVGAALMVRAVSLDSYRTRTHIRAERDLGPGQEV